VIVNNLDIDRAGGPFGPLEADPPLIVRRTTMVIK
jgi:hypothetical protein